MILLGARELLLSSTPSLYLVRIVQLRYSYQFGMAWAGHPQLRAMVHEPVPKLGVRFSMI